MENIKSTTRDKTKQKDRQTNLCQARSLAREAAEMAGKLGYANSEVVAHEVLNDIFTEFNDPKSADKHKKRGGLKRKETGYFTKLLMYND